MSVKTCDDCKQRIGDACLTHLKRVLPIHVACIYHAKKKSSANLANPLPFGSTANVLKGHAS